MIKLLRAVESGKYASMSDCSMAALLRATSDEEGDMSRYTPEVASHACCRNPVDPASLSTSMGMWRRCAAKMAFMMGMYCVLRSGETERMSTRETRRARLGALLAG